MPMIPELPIAMLACARIGAPHTVVFGGFSAEALGGRINDCGAKVLITADGGWRRGKKLALKPHADEAVAGAPTIEHVLVVDRLKDGVATMEPGRDVWWHDIVDRQSAVCPPVAVDSEHMLYLLYTSGTTAKPKGILHTSAGYLLGTAFTHWAVFDIKPDDVYWCAADIGWVTGHSYIVYGPLANATTGVLYEGAPDAPTWDRWWQIIEDYKVTILYCAPTAIRAFMKQGEADPGGARPVVAAGAGLGRRADQPRGLALVPRRDRRRPGPGRRHLVADRDGPDHDQPAAGRDDDQAGLRDVPAARDRGGRGRRRRQLRAARRRRVPRPQARRGPAMLRGIYGDPERYSKTYWSRFPGMYFAGDGAKRDEDGYLWLLGRVDDVMNVAGHRISTTEVESALIDHKSVAESAVVGKTDAISGQAIFAFVILKAGQEASDALGVELREHVVDRHRPDRAAEVPDVRAGPAQDPVGQDHAPAPARHR